MLSYNHEKFIINSLKSVFDNQSDLWQIEVVLIDDGSSDRTAELVEEYAIESGHNINFIKLKHGGISSISRNFNQLVKLASGDFLCFLASDDLYLTNRFNGQFKIMAGDDNVVLCYSDGITAKNGRETGGVLPQREKLLLSTGNSHNVYKFVTSNVPSIFIQGCMIRADFAKSITLFDEELIADDWIFNIHLFREVSSRNLKYAYIDSKVFQRNIHDTNTSRDPVAHFIRVEQVCRKYISNPGVILAQQFVFSVYFCLKSKKHRSSLPRVLKYQKQSGITFCNIVYAVYMIFKSKLSKNYKIGTLNA
jgi:glycosyltransferase involved in cell wall biosynthesis